MKKKHNLLIGGILVACVLIVLLTCLYFLKKKEIEPYTKYTMSISIAKKEEEKEITHFVKVYEDGKASKISVDYLDDFVYIVNNTLYYRVEDEMHYMPVENEYREIIEVLCKIKEVNEKKNDFVISLDNLEDILQAAFFDVQVDVEPTMSLTYDSNAIKTIDVTFKTTNSDIFRVNIVFKELDENYEINTKYIMGLDPEHPSPYEYVKSNENPLEIVFED